MYWKGSIWLQILDQTELENFLLQSSRIGYPHSRKQVLALVQEIVGMEATISNGWWERFCERHPKVALRSAVPLSYAHAVASDPTVILTELEESHIFDQPAHVHILNCDESGMPLKPCMP